MPTYGYECEHCQHNAAAGESGSLNSPTPNKPIKIFGAKKTVFESEEMHMFEVLKETLPILKVTPQRWTNLTASLTPELLNRKPAPGEWSALDCLQHLLDTERWVFPLRVKAFLAGENFPAFDPDAEGDLSNRVKSGPELAAKFAAMRAESLKLLEKLTESDLERRAVHGELGPVTLGEMLAEWPAHDLMHTVQAERALMQPFIPLSGPWDVYFKDHVAQEI